MKTGGFVIDDPDGVELNETLDYTCHDKQVYRTTGKVIDCLGGIALSLKTVTHGRKARFIFPFNIIVSIFKAY